ncbi:MAG: hypothetical protein HY238_25015 [Acidobacteria bacterium]|nr:hypothetical protein [Acidobacteriota bacterium]
MSTKLMSLDHQVIIITGSTGGLGRTVTEQIRSAGARVVASYRGEAPPAWWKQCSTGAAGSTLW